MSTAWSLAVIQTRKWSRREDTSLELPSQDLQLVLREEEKANRKRGKVVETGQTQRKRSKKRKEQRKRQRNLKKAAEEETAHIDEMLEYKSEANRSRMKLGRKTRHQQAAKTESKTKLI
jgi:hypothetical protein